MTDVVWLGRNGRVVVQARREIAHCFNHSLLGCAGAVHKCRSDIKAVARAARDQLIPQLGSRLIRANWCRDWRSYGAACAARFRRSLAISRSHDTDCDKFLTLLLGALASQTLVQ